MQVLYPHCAGVDGHKKTVVACLITPDPQGGWPHEIRSFGTMTRDLLALSEWLLTAGCTHVAMESTGEYWKPVFNLLEAPFEVLWVNAQPIKAVPGRKTMSRMRSGSPSCCTMGYCGPVSFHRPRSASCGS